MRTPLPSVCSRGLKRHPVPHERLLVHRAPIETWLSGEPKLRLSKIHRLLERDGVSRLVRDAGWSPADRREIRWYVGASGTWHGHCSHRRIDSARRIRGLGGTSSLPPSVQRTPQRSCDAFRRNAASTWPTRAAAWWAGSADAAARSRTLRRIRSARAGVASRQLELASAEPKGWRPPAAQWRAPQRPEAHTRDFKSQACGIGLAHASPWLTRCTPRVRGQRAIGVARRSTRCCTRR
jgi:hypothetical protein